MTALQAFLRAGKRIDAELERRGIGAAVCSRWPEPVEGCRMA